MCLPASPSGREEVGRIEGGSPPLVLRSGAGKPVSFLLVTSIASLSWVSFLSLDIPASSTHTLCESKETVYNSAGPPARRLHHERNSPTASSALRATPAYQSPTSSINFKYQPSTAMAPSLRTPTLALALLSICLSIGIIGTAGRSLHVFLSRGQNPWFLPSFPNHFDLRELQTLIGTSAAIVVLDAVIVVALFVSVVSTAIQGK